MEMKIQEKAACVKLFVFDVDGILTDGQLLFGPDGEAMKAFNVQDGHGIRMLQRAGIETAIISARQSPIVRRRAVDLGIQHVYVGTQDKISAFNTLLAKTGMHAADCGYIGDDIIDLPLLMCVGFSASVPNAHHEVRSRVDYVTKQEGGHGAVRELCDLILQAQDKYNSLLKPYLK